ncbi:MAG: DUF1318 domain-containing protein [Pseudomonadota bacterium]|jgi:hypothetical protein|nr:DUF1318 domain-containing protein [Pseudomonadota bacterium]MEC7702463.1 DUF1318 domain-containing protein [Pseudomonadota bacterium]MEC9236493.1 DUF1318 domain-containing protein [Pseudomonadota bacterium]MED5422919.1 DUF1318 domain-containing protein [Pseudomonadota bacterium]MEE3322367.1 DUF1318 domain-containing protein [Pseudomonadota bacterium]
MRNILRPFLIVTALSVLMPSIAIAQQINTAVLTQEQAKQYGLIGEMPNGLVGHVRGAFKDTNIDKLINEVNKGRMLIYKTAAKKKGVPVEYVQVKAADEFYKKVGPGQFYYRNGGWVKR